MKISKSRRLEVPNKPSSVIKKADDVVTNIFISVFRIRMYFLRIRIRRSVILNYGSGPGTREANSLEIRPDPEPIRTLLWSFNNMWSNRYVLAPIPYIIINLKIFFPKICLNVLQNSKDPDPKHYLMYKRKIATCEISKWSCNPGYIWWTNKSQLELQLLITHPVRVSALHGCCIRRSTAFPSSFCKQSD